MRVIFIASDIEVAEWKKQAALVRMSISGFIRARLNGVIGFPAHLPVEGVDYVNSSHVHVSPMPAGKVELASNPVASRKANKMVDEINERMFPRPFLSADDVRASLEARKAAPVDMSKILP